MSKAFAGKVAIITGSGHGIGREAALALASDEASYLPESPLVVR